MTIRKTPYDTFIGAAFSKAVMQKVIYGIEDAMLQSSSIYSNVGVLGIRSSYPTDGYMASDKNYQAGVVAFSSPGETMVPPFIFPVLVENPNNVPNSSSRNFALVADARHFLKPDPKSPGGSKVVNSMELSLLKIQLGLNLMWLAKGPVSLANMGQIQHKVFCRWLGGAISPHFELDATERLKVRAMAAFYYQCMFIEPESFNETSKSVMISTTIQTSGVNAQIVLDTLNDVEHIPSIEAFISEVKRKLSNPRLDGLNIGLLAKKIGGTWFGFNGRELACAALEHPPTFVALLYNSLGQNSYKRTGLAKISEEFRGNGGGSELLRSVQINIS